MGQPGFEGGRIGLGPGCCSLPWAELAALDTVRQRHRASQEIAVLVDLVQASKASRHGSHASLGWHTGL